MTLSERINVLTQLGKHLTGEDDYLEAVMAQAKFHNAWFTIENQQLAINNIAQNFLREEKLLAWTSQYDISDDSNQKNIGLVLAGNTPLAGFHDVLCVFVAGHTAQIKLSDQDKYLLPYFIKLLERFDERTKDYFEVIERLSGFEVIIATGGNDSARSFETYFGKYPNIIRRNKNSIAILTGEESEEELMLLGEDVFHFFGLSSRNVSKVYIPKEFNFSPLLTAFHEYRKIVLNAKYKNNFDHNYALYILNKIPYEANGCILLTENKAYQSLYSQKQQSH